MPQPVKICAVFELTCFAIGGINSIKAALTEGEKCSTKDIKLHVSLNAPPEYWITAVTQKKAECIELINSALNAIKEKIQQLDGKLVVKVSPFIVGKNNEKEMEDRLAALNREEDNEFVHDD